MITLDYRTDNPRWGLSGMKFTNWGNFALTLGFLSNIDHYKGYSRENFLWNNSISIHVESNDNQGAWNKEGRIHFYNNIDDLEITFNDLFLSSSRGNLRTTCRINSNNYIFSLINDFGFRPEKRMGYSTADVFPPEEEVLEKFISFMNLNRFPDMQVRWCIEEFKRGYYL